MINHNFSRRNFLKKSAVTTGLASMGMGTYAFTNNPPNPEKGASRLPREVWIAGISQMDLYTRTPQLMVDEIIRIVKDVVVCQPDIICLPEAFPFLNVEQKLNISEQLKISEDILPLFSDLAKKHNCYMICPVYTSEGGKAYNAAVVFNRTGSRVGEYRKTHITTGEIKSGLTPGPLQTPVFQADFGKFGIQICYDIYWNEGWENLRDQGAEIVFWPSAFAAGQRVNIKASENQYIVVSSTRKNTSKICDLRGEVIAQTDGYDKNFFCGSVNLEKVLINTWPYSSHFSEIRRKYGRKIRITTFYEELWTVIESLSPDVFVADILRDFEIKTLVQEVYEAEIAQIKARKG